MIPMTASLPYSDVTVIRRCLVRAEGEEMGASKSMKRQWTDREVRQLQLLINNRFSRDEIARLLGRTPSSVQQKAFWLNLSFAQRRTVQPRNDPFRVAER
jgi:hypothetical protein